MEFEEEGNKVRVFLHTWDVDTFKRVCVATLDRYSSDPHQEITALGRMVDALGPDVSVASISGGSTVLVEAFCEYLGLLEICCEACCVTVFMGISSGASKPFISNSLSRCDSICSYVLFSKCAWLIDFFRCGGILA